MKEPTNIEILESIINLDINPDVGDDCWNAFVALQPMLTSLLAIAKAFPGREHLDTMIPILNRHAPNDAEVGAMITILENMRENAKLLEDE